MGWLSGWLSRKSHVINQAAGAGTNYQIPLKVSKVPTFDNVTPNGILEWFNKPSAIYFSGTYNRTYFSFVDNAGKVKIKYFDHTSNSWSDEVTVYDFGSADDHRSPSMLILPTGHILLWFTAHEGNILQIKSTNAEDISTWDATQTVASGTYSYPKPLRLPNGDIWLFARFYNGAVEYDEYYFVSTDNGGSWDAGTKVWDTPSSANYRVYAFVYLDSAGKIHFACTYEENAVWKKHYYAYRDTDGQWKTHSGNVSLPLSPTNAELIWNSDPDLSWIYDLVTDASNVPYLAIMNKINTDTHEATWVKWDGSSWIKTVVTDSSSDGFHDYSDIYSAGMVIDPDDVYKVYVGAKTTGYITEMQEWTSLDQGASWSKTKDITQNSSYGHARPQMVKNYSSTLKLIWCYVTYYPTYTNFNSQIYCYSLPADNGINVRTPSARDDFGDIRFTDDDGTTLLDYWIQEKIDGIYAIFWVEVRDDLNAGNQTIYIYYDKADATTTSNGDNTFIFFDDFPNASLDLNKWVVRGGAVTVSNSELVLTGIATPRGLIDGLVSYLYKAIHTKVRMTTTCRYASFAGGRLSNSWDAIARAFSSASAGNVTWQTLSGGSSTNVDEAVLTKDIYHVYKLLWKAGEVKYYQDDILYEVIATNVPSVSLVPMFYEGDTVGHDAWVDWVFVRNYVDPEPAHGSWGTEEASPPADPTNLSGACVGSTRIDLTWTDNATDEDGYKIERDDGGWHEIDDLPADSNSYSDTTVNCGGAGYKYRVRAYKNAGPTYSNYDTLGSAIVCGLQDPTGIAATPLAVFPLFAIRLNWNDVCTCETSVRVERNDGGWHEIGFAAAGSTQFDDYTITCGVAYLYRIRNYDSVSGLYSGYNTLASPTYGLLTGAEPTNLTATPISEGRIDLAWTENCPCETNVLVERNEDGGAYNQIASLPPNSNSYSDTSVVCGVLYSYRIRVYDSVSGNYSGYVTLSSQVYTPLTDPTNIQAVRLGSTTVRVTWTDNCGCETWYMIERDMGSGFAVIATASAGTVLYDDTPPCGTDCLYRVRAYDSVTDSYSNYATLGSPIQIPCPSVEIQGKGKSVKPKPKIDYFANYLDYGTIRAAIRRALEETIPITASVEKSFEETVGIRAKVAEAFEETMPITASIIKSFQETVQAKGNIVQKFEETVEISSDIMRAIFQESMVKVKGIVVPLFEKLKELKRRMEEITADDVEELRRKIEEMEEED